MNGNWKVIKDVGSYPEFNKPVYCLVDCENPYVDIFILKDNLPRESEDDPMILWLFRDNLDCCLDEEYEKIIAWRHYERNI